MTKDITKEAAVAEALPFDDWFDTIEAVAFAMVIANGG